MNFKKITIMKSKITGLKIAVFLIALSLFTSCVSKKDVILLQDKSKKDIKGEFKNDKKAPYKIQAGDQLYIRIYSVDKQTSAFFQTNMPTVFNPTYMNLNSYTVDEGGFLDFSFVDKVQVKGLTTEEAKKLIQEKLNEFFKESTVVVKLVNYTITVLGEVKTPGEYQANREQINVFQALGLAGGMTETGNYRKVVLVRKTEDGSSITYLDLTRKTILESEFYYLMPNDIIYVEPLGNSKTTKVEPFVFAYSLFGVFLGTFLYSILK